MEESVPSIALHVLSGFISSTGLLPNLTRKVPAWQGVVAQARNPSTLEMVAAGTEVQHHPQPHRELEASLSRLRVCRGNAQVPSQGSIRPALRGSIYSGLLCSQAKVRIS